jgi:hypothetical protein
VCGTRWACWSPPATDTRCRGSCTPRPPPTGPPPHLRSPGTARGARWPSHSPPATDTRCLGSPTPCPPPLGLPPRQALPVVLDGLAEVPLRLIRAPEVRVRPALTPRSPTSFAIARSCVWYSMAFA